MTIKRLFPSFVFLFLLNATAACAQEVTLVYDETVPQEAYAARKLGEALEEQGYELGSDRSGYDHLVSLSVREERLGSEAFAIVPEDRITSVYGGDHRGLIYGALALADTLRNGTPLTAVEATEQSPNLAFRGIRYNLPWGNLPAQFGAGPALRDRTGSRLLGVVSGYDGGEPFQRHQPVESASFHVHDPAEKLPRSEPLVR